MDRKRNKKGQYINQGKTKNTVVKRITKKEWNLIKMLNNNENNLIKEWFHKNKLTLMNLSNTEDLDLLAENLIEFLNHES